MTENIFEGELDKKPKGIFINANNKGYCRIAFDYDSL